MGICEFETKFYRVNVIYKELSFFCKITDRVESFNENLRTLAAQGEEHSQRIRNTHTQVPYHQLRVDTGFLFQHYLIF